MNSIPVGDIFAGTVLILTFIAVVIGVDKMLQEWDKADEEDFLDD